ncbi:putative Ig domain-containing protein [Myxococcus sp. K38C18041901]|uniref:putative Ig domain-containing protein n=1 Tax=Myxococcus guangdongensis TaxID=2906760 RepID=UPI0020A800A1|nr:putative Ig domain-containing protein [Myxococcus guangdongensis]MCP3062748.1 putative Ig domain-containing protein [Myxococcus guangdongensis]
MRLRRTLSLLLVLSLAACSSSPPPKLPDTPDSGPGPSDGGGNHLSFQTTSLPDAYLGESYSTPLVASGGTAPLIWRLASGELPSGLSFSAQGLVSGTPAAVGTFSATFQVDDGSGARISKQLELTVLTPPTLANANLSLGVVGAPYSFTFTASGGRPPLSLHVASGTLPAGLRLEALSLAGTPTAAGTSSFTLEARDANNRSASAAFQLTVRDGLTITATHLPDAYTDRTYAQALTALGGKAPYTWTLVSGTLPPGLSLRDSGNLEGTPTTSGDFPLVLRVTDSAGATDSREVSLSTYLPPTLAAVPALSLYVQDNVTRPLSASQGKPPYVFTTTGPLPPGITLAREGLLHGQPTQSGAFTFNVVASDANSRTISVSVSVSVSALPTITTQTLPEATRGIAYQHTLGATGGQGTLAWTLASGALPSGISLSTQGALSGTPSTTGSHAVTLRVSDANGRTDSRALALVVEAPLSLSGTLADGYAGTSYSSSVTAAGGRAPLAWSIASGALPSGLTLAPENGLVSGTLAPSATSSTVTLRATDAASRSATHQATVAVYALPTVTTDLLPPATLGQPYSTQLAASGGKTPITWSIASGALPSGLSLSASGGISGTTNASATTFTARATDANGRFADKGLSVTTIAPPPAVTTATLPDATVGQAYSVTLAATGGQAPLRWSTSSTLPAGLSLSTTGTLSGTPTTAGTPRITFVVTDSRDTFASRELPLKILPAGVEIAVGHWNLEWFGSDTQGPPNSTSPGGTLDDLQISHTRDILRTTGANIWGLVEVVDSQDFATLLAQLPNYSGFISNDTSRVPNAGSIYTASGQKLAILYDDSVTFQSAELILVDVANRFGGRPPLRVNFTLRGTTTPLTVIVLHMKASADEYSHGLRTDASASLKYYLEDHPVERLFVIGDWNDDLDESITTVAGIPKPTPYENFVSDSRYTFITRALTSRSESTTTGYSETIDHTLVNASVAGSFVPSSLKVVRPTDIPDYGNVVSDHYPVISRYAFGGAPPPAPMVIINEVLANEPSTPNGNGTSTPDPDYEFIELVNLGTTPVDLSGWTLSDAASVRHVFGNGTLVPAGGAYVVFGGNRGYTPGTPNTVSASSGTLGLNNTSDSVYLRALDSATVDQLSYTATEDDISINRSPDTQAGAPFVRHPQLNPALRSSPGRRANGAAF